MRRVLHQCVLESVDRLRRSTALGNQFWSMRINEPIAALPLQIFVYAMSPYDEWHRLAWAGALVLIVLIMVSVTLVRIYASRGVLKGGS